MLWLLQTETTREGQRLFPQQAEASSRQFNRIVGSAAAEEGMAVVDAYNMSIGAARSDYVHSLSHLVLARRMDQWPLVEQDLALTEGAGRDQVTAQLGAVAHLEARLLRQAVAFGVRRSEVPLRATVRTRGELQLYRKGVDDGASVRDHPGATRQQ